MLQWVTKHSILSVLSLLLLAFILSNPLSALDMKEYRIAIVTDTEQDFSKKIVSSFKTAVDAAMKLAGAKVIYTEYFTALDPNKANTIRQALTANPPDLAFMVNSPTCFADINITLKLSDPKFRFVSENTLPIQSGVAKTMQKPGGNVTGVGVLIQQRSIVRLMKMINPKVNRLAFASWDKVTLLNQWFEQDIREACRLENIELAEFRLLPYVEAEYQFYRDWDQQGPNVFAMVGVSAWVSKDGSPLKLGPWLQVVQKELSHLAILSYDEVPISNGKLAGTSVVWDDIGLQLAEKALLVLGGKNPGDIPWDFPRKFNIMINLQTAKDKGITIPQNLIDSAYRVYTDYKGTYIQAK